MNSAEIRKVKAKIIATDKLMKCYDKKKQEIDVLNKNIVKLHRDYSKEMEDVALKLKSAIDEIDKLHDDKNLINYHYLNSQKIITDLKLEIEYLKKHNHELLSSINVKKGSITAEQCTTNSSTCPNYILYQNALGEIKSLKEDSKKRDLKEDPEFEKYLQDIEDGAITDTDLLTMPDQKISDKKKCTLLKVLIGEIAEKRFENSNVTESDKFTNTFQGSNETIEAYIDRLNNLTTYCKFVDRKEKIRDQLVRGIKNRRAVEEIK
ncbi:hypothetical protein A3Q56_07817, partial [Intoshia linei]